MEKGAIFRTNNLEKYIYPSYNCPKKETKSFMWWNNLYSSGIDCKK